jgi:hypothetical protein
MPRGEAGGRSLGIRARKVEGEEVESCSVIHVALESCREGPTKQPRNSFALGESNRALNPPSIHLERDGRCTRLFAQICCLNDGIMESLPRTRREYGFASYFMRRFRRLSLSLSLSLSLPLSLSPSLALSLSPSLPRSLSPSPQGFA